MPDYGLSSQQIEVINALSSGVTMTAAAELAGVHRNTISNWRRNSFPFQQALAQAQYDRALLFHGKAEELFELAFKTIHDILADPQAPPSVRLRAALAVVAAATTPPEPKKKLELEIEKVIVATNPPAVSHPPGTPRSDTAQPMHNSAQPVTPAAAPPASSPHAKSAQPVHNSAQSSVPVRGGIPQIGRNEACSLRLRQEI